MLTSTKIVTHHLAFATFIVIAFGLCIFMLISSWLLGGRSQGRYKNTPFESGIDSVGNAHLRFSAKFYLVAMFFVIFDVETSFLYAWSISIRENGWIGFTEALIFILVLLVGLIYLVRIGALDWAPQRRFMHIAYRSKMHVISIVKNSNSEV